MLSKRLLKKPSFILLLCLIPAVLPFVNSAMSEDSGVLRIALCNENNYEITSNIIDDLTSRDGIILFSVYDSKEESVKAVKNRAVDAVWIFPDDFDDRITNFSLNKKNKPLVEIVQCEDTVSLKLSNEILFGALYNNLSRSVYRSFIELEFKENHLSTDEINSYYDAIDNPNNIIKLKRLDSDEPVPSSNYLTVPIRGILSLFIVFSSLASAMYFLKDQSDGKFSWLPKKKRLAPAFASCLSASCFSSIAVLLALQFSNISVDLKTELISMLLFVFSTSGFCLLMCLLFNSYGKLGAALPGLIIVMLVLSPIFFNLKSMKFLRILLPTHYYLYSIYNPIYHIYSIIYCVAVYSICLIINSLQANRKQQSL